MIVKVLHDAFRKALDDAKVREMFERFDMPAICLNSEEYKRIARRSWESERSRGVDVGVFAQAGYPLTSAQTLDLGHQWED